MRRAPSVAVAAVAVAAALATLASGDPAAADTVRLKNGRSYEGVIAEHVPEGVRVQLAFGHIVLPHDQVLAVEKAPSHTAEYLRRKADLVALPDDDAADWLELARWSRDNDLPHGVRESALAAAEMDPTLEGLDPLLRPLGFVYDEQVGRWMEFEESMARRGMVLDEGEWVTVAVQRQRDEERAQRRAALAQEEATRRMTAAAESMERTQRYQEQYADYEYVYYPPGYWGYPLYYPYYPILPGHPGVGDPDPGRPGRPGAGPGHRPGHRPTPQANPPRNHGGRMAPPRGRG